jgi:hypothetical protein
MDQTPYLGTTLRKVGAVILMLLGFLWLIPMAMVPKYWDKVIYFEYMIFLIPIIGANLLYPRTDEKSRVQAKWFAIVNGLFATPVVCSVTFAFLQARK